MNMDWPWGCQCGRYRFVYVVVGVTERDIISLAEHIWKRMVGRWVWRVLGMRGWPCLANPAQAEAYAT
jgi:hypothetical protein